MPPTLDGSIYSRLLDHCSPPPQFPSPWDFLPPGPGTYGAVADPPRALSVLSAKYCLDDLTRSGILRAGPKGPRLAPNLVRKSTTIIPLRENADGPPIALMVGRGCLPAQQDPIWAARTDAWTAERVVAAMRGKRTFTVRLSQPVQVILFYLTAAVMPEDGTVRFADDIYGHDERLDSALRKLRN